MKKINIFLIVVLTMMLAFVVYFFVGSMLDADVHMVSAAASDHPEAFASIQNTISSNTAPQRFTNDVPTTADGYTLIDVNITLSNKGVFPAEWISAEVEGVNGDVAVYSLSGVGSSISGRSSGQMNLKLITAASKNASRRIYLTYYVFGMERTLTLYV